MWSGVTLQIVIAAKNGAKMDFWIHCFMFLHISDDISGNLLLSYYAYSSSKQKDDNIWLLMNLNISKLV